MTFGEKLQKLRAREGLSQDALAEALDVSRQAVSKWERDEAMPEAEKLVRISDRFSVTIDSLLRPDREPAGPASSGRRAQALPELEEIWRRYGRLLAWALAVWGGWRCIRVAPVLAMFAETGTDSWMPLAALAVYYLVPGLSVALCGVMTACLWRRAGALRRRHVGAALVLWSALNLAGRGGMALLAWMMRHPADEVTGQWELGGGLLWFYGAVLAAGLILLCLRRCRKSV